MRSICCEKTNAFSPIAIAPETSPVRGLISGPGLFLIHHTVPPAALPAVVPPCGVWLIRPQSSLLVALHPAPYGGQVGGATHSPYAKPKFDGGFGVFFNILHFKANNYIRKRG